MPMPSDQFGHVNFSPNLLATHNDLVHLLPSLAGVREQSPTRHVSGFTCSAVQMLYNATIENMEIGRFIVWLRFLDLSFVVL